MTAHELEIRRALDQVKTYDPHCHLRVHKPTADNLADILQYHHVWIELVSAGMGQQEVTCTGLPQELADTQITPLERVRRMLPYIPLIANTTLGLFLRWILRDLYHVDSLTTGNLEEVWSLAESRGRDPGWTDELLGARCGIEASISVEHDGIPCSPRFMQARELYVTNLSSGKLTPPEVLAGWERALGREIRNAADYVEFLQATAAGLSPSSCRFIGLWVLPHFSGEIPTEEHITTILDMVRDRKPLEPADTGGFCAFGLVRLLESLRATPIRLIQLIVGAEVLPPHRSITQWDGAFSGSMARLANRFEDFHFSLSSASDLYTQDIGVLAKHLPNVSVAGYWWHVLYPFYLKKSLDTRLDMVPINKIVAYFSDAYHAEWCYPKLKMVKQVMYEVLQERIQRGWYSLDTALQIIDHVFHENPRRIYFTHA